VEDFSGFASGLWPVMLFNIGFLLVARPTYRYGQRAWEKRRRIKMSKGKQLVVGGGLAVLVVVSGTTAPTADRKVGRTANQRRLRSRFRTHAGSDFWTR